MNIKKQFNMSDFLNAHGSVYFEDENMKISRYAGFDDWVLTDLTYALRPGHNCRQYTIKTRNGAHGNLEVTNWIESMFKGDIKALWIYCEGLNDHDIKPYEPFTVRNVEIYRSDIQSIRVFSPFNLNYVKPLKSMPKKWTLTHVRSALVNGQFKDLKCNYVLTDDYAFDAAVNFRKGEIKAPLEFIKGIIEHPSGWKAWVNDSTVSVCCHSFESNEFTPVIN